MTELLPCPFCGGAAEQQKGPIGHSIRCVNATCGLVVQTFAGPKEQAITAWNTRSGNTRHTTQQETEE